ncbi:hypothetical protein VPH35_019668 [Triticum aestivum]
MAPPPPPATDERTVSAGDTHEAGTCAVVLAVGPSLGATKCLHVYRSRYDMDRAEDSPHNLRFPSFSALVCRWMETSFFLLAGRSGYDPQIRFSICYRTYNNICLPSISCMEVCLCWRRPVMDTDLITRFTV